MCNTYGSIEDNAIKMKPWHGRLYHDDIIKWKYFPCDWPFVRETTGHRWIPLSKASDAELW